MKQNSFPIILIPGDKVFVRVLFNWRKPITYLSSCIRLFTKIQYNNCRIVTEYKGRLVYVQGVVPTLIKYDPTVEKLLVRRNFVLVDKYEYQEQLRKIISHKKKTFTLLIIETLWSVFNIWLGAKSEEKALHRLISFETVFFADKKYLHKEFPKLSWWKLHPRDVIYTDYTYTIFED